MPDVISYDLLRAGSGAPVTGTTTEKWSFTSENDRFAYIADVRNVSSMSVYALRGAGTTTLTTTIEVTSDPSGLGGWAAAATRLPGGGVYSALGVSISNTGTSLFFDPTDNVAWVRANISANDGTDSFIKLIAEV